LWLWLTDGVDVASPVGKVQDEHTSLEQLPDHLQDMMATDDGLDEGEIDLNEMFEQDLLETE
jgi:hypothetical protein